MEINCYCDASYDPKTKNAVCGYIINSKQINLHRIKNTNNTRAEIIGLIKLLEKINNTINFDDKINIYTDCQSVLKRIKSKEKLIKNNYCNKKGIKLNNADLLEKLFLLLQPNIILNHIDGHIPKK